MTDTVMMGCSIDVSDMTDEQVTLVQQMANVFEEQFQLFVEKNRGYGNVFETGGHSEMQRDEPVFGSAFEANLYRLWCRIQDKDNRFYSQAFGESDDLETVDETSGDAANYWMMVTLLSRYRAPVTDSELAEAYTDMYDDEYAGTEPGEWKEVNPDAEELFDEKAAIRLQVREFIENNDPATFGGIVNEVGNIDDAVEILSELYEGEMIYSDSFGRYETAEELIDSNDTVRSRVHLFIRSNEPASLRDVKQKFGEEGQDALYELIDDGVVEDTGTWKYRIVDESAESDDGCGCKHCSYYKQ